MKRGLTALGIFAATVSMPLPTRAQDNAPAPSDQLEALVDLGVQHYKAKRYVEAADAFDRAFAIRPAPELAYNVARAYERGLQLDKAIDAYMRFLSIPGTTSDLRGKARTALNALEREQAIALEAKSPSAQAATMPSKGIMAVDLDEPSRVLEYSLLGAGVATAAIGLAFAIQATSANSDFETAQNRVPADPSRIASLEDDVNRNALLADIFIGTGLAAAGAGVLLFFVRGSKGSDDSTTQIVPMITDGQMSLGAIGQF
ncbi:MAG: hypothetical protein AAF449_23800 [Myxococcota bacterium]